MKKNDIQVTHELRFLVIIQHKMIDRALPLQTMTDNMI